jgi:hypothetical protein
MTGMKHQPSLVVDAEQVTFRLGRILLNRLSRPSKQQKLLRHQTVVFSPPCEALYDLVEDDNHKRILKL